VWHVCGRGGIHTGFCVGRPIEKDKMGWACGTYGEEEGYIQGFVWGNLSRRMRWAGNVARMGKRRGTYRVLVEKPVGKGHSKITRPMWDNTKQDI